MTVLRARWLLFFFVFMWGGYIHCLQPKERWVYTYHGCDDPADSLDYANAIVYGDDGNLYAVGGSKGRTAWKNTDDFVVISLTTDGALRWRYEYSGAHSVYEQAYAVVYGNDGNVYAAGQTCNITGIDTVKAAFTIISLQPDSTERWVHSDDSGSANAIAYGDDGNIYAAGNTKQNGLSYFTVACVDTAGDLLWKYVHESTWGWANSIVYGEDGNIYAVGVLWGHYGDFAVVCLDAETGNEKWVRTYDGPGWEYWDWYCDCAHAVAYGDGYIYVAGSFAKTWTVDFTVMTFDSSGNRIWDFYYNGTENYLDEAYAIVYGDDGNIYAAGYSCDTLLGGRECCFTVISLTSAGDTNYTYKYSKVPYTDNYATSLAFGLDGNIYAAGATYGEHYDFTVFKILNTGIKEWMYTFDGTDTLYGGDDVAYSIVYGPDSFLYIAGYNDDSVTHHDFTVISLGNRKPLTDTIVKFNQNFPIGQMGADGLSNLTFCLYQNAPNPFRADNGTEIRYAIPRTSRVKLSIYNCAGQCVETVVDRIQTSGVYRVIWRRQDDAAEVLPHGIYFCTISALPIGETDCFCDIKKLLLVR
jgi:hypothetical protein